MFLSNLVINGGFILYGDTLGVTIIFCPEIFFQFILQDLQHIQNYLPYRFFAPRQFLLCNIFDLVQHEPHLMGLFISLVCYGWKFTLFLNSRRSNPPSYFRCRSLFSTRSDVFLFLWIDNDVSGSCFTPVVFKFRQIYGCGRTTDFFFVCLLLVFQDVVTALPRQMMNGGIPKRDDLKPLLI